MLRNGKGTAKPRNKEDLVLPTKEMVYFPLREESEADTLPAFFLETEKQKEYVKRTFSTMHERLEYIGISAHPESYFNLSEIKDYVTSIKKTTWLSETVTTESRTSSAK